MYSKNNILDINMLEVNKLFSAPVESDLFQPFSNIGQSPYNQSPRNSSSNDSNTPESFKDISRRNDDIYTVRRQRPIFGRRIMIGDTQPTFEQTNFDALERSLSNIWKDDNDSVFSQTPPKYYNEHNYKNDCYELFPNDNRSQEVRNSLTNFTTSPVPSTYRPYAPHNMRASTPLAPTQYQPTFAQAPRFDTNFSMNAKICSFCRKNGEAPNVYGDHTVRERVGNRSIVSCPILRRHVCTTCGESGDNAHTITYCPVLRRTNNGAPLQSTTITLKNTRVKSNGRRRF